jgi:hypothetical protein
MATAQTGTNPSAHPSGCCCAACLGLECLGRPRFFPGQLLSEQDLNAGLDYVRAKTRLHNRYLHGPGVVCGLEVVCHDCDGLVTVKSGYAIDPCGNDIVVCQDVDFDVLKAIKACCDARKRQRRTDCDPYQPPSDPGCQEVEQHWCITIKYQETQARPVTALRNSTSQACGCGSSGGCGCGCGGQSSGTMSSSATNGCSGSSSSTATASTTPSLGACEPTRILEGYLLGVVEEPQDGCFDLSKILQQTLYGRILTCLRSLSDYISRRLPATNQDVVLATAAGELSGDTQVQSVFETCCRLRQIVIDLYTNNPFNVHCQSLRVLDQIRCTSPREDLAAADYVASARSNLENLLTLLFQYVLDCICHNLLPPCSANPCDDRLILACVTIRNGQIVNICNFSCRRFAGAFPSLYYWLSAIPIVPYLLRLILRICCDEGQVRSNSPVVNELVAFLAKIDPNGGLRRALFEGRFALPKMYESTLGEAIGRLTLENIANAIPPGSLNVATLNGLNVDAAQGMCVKAKVTAVVRELRSPDEVPVLATLLQRPFAAGGDTVTLYVSGAKVAAAVRTGAAEALQEQVRAMRAELDSLKASLQTPRP